MLEFKDATIEFVTAHPITHKTIKVLSPGKIAVGTGLGYWIGDEDEDEPGEPTFYALTHIPSGTRLGSDPIYSEESMQEAIKEIHPLIDWNRPLDQLLSDPNYQGVLRQVKSIYTKHWLQSIAAHAQREGIFDR